MLLFSGSIIFEICCIILLAAQSSVSQTYDYSSEHDDYGPESEEGGEYSHPDYTKYFSDAGAESGAVQSKTDPSGYASGFVNPAEFESFFNSPLGFNEPSSKASAAAPQSFAPQPAKKPDPFEALRQTFNAKEAASEPNAHKKDYLNAKQKKKKTKGSIVHPGPHYVSHQIPIPEAYESDEDEAQSKDDVETIPPPLKGKHNTKRVQVDPALPGFDGFKDSYDAFELFRKTEEQIEQTKVDPSYSGKKIDPDTYEAYDLLRNTEEQIEQTKIDPSKYYSGKNADYNTGKSSSTVSHGLGYPQATGYLSLKIPTTTLTPYQKYSFRPDTTNYDALQSKYFEQLVSTANPLKYSESRGDGEGQTSNVVSENAKNKNCRKIASPENSDGMNCFVCEDAGNKSKYTQCSYSSSDEPVNNYAGSSIRYSSAVKAPHSIRARRSPRKNLYSDDPYFQVSQNNRKYFEDYEKEQKSEESKRDKDFHYSYDPEEYESYSETQSAELLKEPGACQKIDREGMTCTVCKNAKTGGNFEQCSYTSAPKEQKYAYVAEKKYDSEEDEPEETKTIIKQSSEQGEEPQQKGESSSIVQSTVAPEAKFTTATKSKIIRDAIPELETAGSSIDETSAENPESDEESDDEESENNEESDDNDEKRENRKQESSDDDRSHFFTNYDELKKEKKLVDDDPYYVPEHFAESVSEKKTAEEAEDEDNFDEYHYKLFPEFQKGAESKNEEQARDPEKDNQQDVEEVLAEFAKKDRSNCKKAEKNGMTCFLCVDQNKVQHEECMYIAESKPKPIHVAFHEVQRLKDPNKEPAPSTEAESDSEESKQVKTVTQQPIDSVLPLASETSKRKRFFKKVVTTPLPLLNLELAAAASDSYKTIVPFEKSKKRYSKKFRKDSKSSGSAPDSERLENEESKKTSSEDAEAPKEIDVNDEEGAYSHETEPVYSKRFGTTLPKYMVEKTEFEKEFDAASGFD